MFYRNEQKILKWDSAFWAVWFASMFHKDNTRRMWFKGILGKLDTHTNFNFESRIMKKIKK